jgi:hypothetical protein
MGHFDISGPQWVGIACEDNADCGPSRTCVDREHFDGFGVRKDIDVPGGMCSVVVCQNDAACGPNGTCFDASFLGAPVPLCLAQCNAIADCCWQERWDCMLLSTVGEDGEGGVCVCDSIQVAIVCNNGQCSEEAQ